MNLKIKLLLTLLFSFNVSAQSINLKGKIIDSVTNLPIPYAGIGIQSTDEGGITNELGEFNLSISGIYLDKEILFSAVGYLDRSIKLQELKENDFIKLTQNAMQLDEVVITSKKYKTKIIGKEKKPFLTKIHFFNDEDPAVELGTLFDIPSNTRLKKFNFHIPLASKFKEIKLKLNIYGVKDNHPDRLIINQNIIFTVKQQEIGWIPVDLSSYRINLKGYSKIAITCQLLEKTNLEDSPFSFGFSTYKTLNNLILKRNRSQSQWQSLNGNLLANCEISYLDEKNIKDKPTNTNEGDGSADLKELDLKNYYLNLEEEKKARFGSDSLKGSYVTLDDAKIYYEIYGSGEPIVLLHGNSGKISNFFRQIPELSKNYQVIAIDTRGQGKSLDFSTGKLSYEKFSEDLVSFLKTLNLAKVNLLGWSDGGNTALITAFKHPEMVNKLIVVGANLNPDGVEDFLLNNIYNQLKDLELKSETHTSDYRLKQLLVEEPHINTADLSRITAKTLLIVGERDVIKPEHTQVIEEYVSDCKLIVIKDASHYVPQEKQSEFNSVVTNFLQGQE